MRKQVYLIGGGVRSGKSAHALRLAQKAGKRRAFIATGIAFDDEMSARIAAHIEERKGDYMTYEEPTDLPERLRTLAREPLDHDVVVVDCLTLWLSNLLLSEENPQLADTRVEEAIESLRKVVLDLPFDLVLVTNEVGMGIVPEHALARRFRDHAGRLHQVLASAATEVHFAMLGTMVRLKPGPLETVFPT